MNCKHLFLALFFSLLFVSCFQEKNENKSIANKYKNVLNVHFTPEKPFPKDDHYHPGFRDRGAWFGFFLPETANSEGAFSGPIIVAEEYPVYLAEFLSKISISDNDNNTILTPKKSNLVESDYYPGKLKLKYKIEEITLSLELQFVSADIAAVNTVIQTDSKTDRKLTLFWNGKLLPYKNDAKFQIYRDGVGISFKGLREKDNYYSTSQMRYRVVYPFEVSTNFFTDTIYSQQKKEPILVNVDSSFSFMTFHTFTYTKERRQKAIREIKKMKNRSEDLFVSNNERWKKMLSKAVSYNAPDNKLQKLAVKALMTLNGNSIAKNGTFKREAIVPSAFYKWFNGVWAWDSWKQAVGIAPFNPQLAQNNILTLFDYQIKKSDSTRPQDEGMIIDCVFYNDDTNGGGNWNERNSKPPLAAWAVWETFSVSHDTAFLQKMYPKLIKYHFWWYKNRDHDRDYICEYGATVHEKNFVEKRKDGTTRDNRLVAAAWETGGDNSVRFDPDWEITMLENVRDGELVGYSINQESVDLSSFLCAEKIFLAKIASALDREKDAEKWLSDSKFLAKYISENMFDKETGWFYDTDISTKKLLVGRGKAPEGWIALWAGAATQAQAEAVMKNIIDTSEFNTFVPFPTASRSNPRFSPTGYWRGPVWLSTAWFGIKGLRNYGYDSIADELSLKLINNAEGLVDSDMPIRENYNPLNGDGLCCQNFSWSAAHLLMILDELKKPAGR